MNGAKSNVWPHNSIAGARQHGALPSATQRVFVAADDIVGAASLRRKETTINWKKNLVALQ